MMRSSFIARAALAGWLLGGGAGCSVLLATDAEQCSVDADCTARGAAFAATVCTASVCVPKPDPKWGCIGSVAPLTSGGTAPFKVQLLDLLSNAPVATNLTIELCNKLDPTCASPLGAALPVDSMGWVSATVASDFEGYLDITDTTGNYLPSLIFIDVVAIGQNPSVLLIPKGAEQGLAANANVTVDPTAALMLTRTVDCTEAATAGASVGVSPLGAATGFYLINSSVLVTATETDSAGDCGFINLAAPQSLTVTGTVGPGGAEFGRVTTLVRPGAMTYQLLRPTNPP